MPVSTMINISLVLLGMLIYTEGLEDTQTKNISAIESSIETLNPTEFEFLTTLYYSTPYTNSTEITPNAEKSFTTQSDPTQSFTSETLTTLSDSKHPKIKNNETSVQNRSVISEDYNTTSTFPFSRPGKTTPSSILQTEQSEKTVTSYSDNTTTDGRNNSLNLQITNNSELSSSTFPFSRPRTTIPSSILQTEQNRKTVTSITTSYSDNTTTGNILDRRNNSHDRITNNSELSSSTLPFSRPLRTTPSSRLQTQQSQKTVTAITTTASEDFSSTTKNKTEGEGQISKYQEDKLCKSVYSNWKPFAIAMVTVFVVLAVATGLYIKKLRNDLHASKMCVEKNETELLMRPSEVPNEAEPYIFKPRDTDSKLALENAPSENEPLNTKTTTSFKKIDLRDSTDF